MITARVVTDSVSTPGIRLTTLELRYPKFIHSEFMTHRVFSRSASSSRAVPVARTIQEVVDDPALPVAWLTERRGMQGGEALPEAARVEATDTWLAGRDRAVETARELARLGAHKQLVNRVLEPWAHVRVIVTATDWANFFALRRHQAAQPEMRALADAIWVARESSSPRWLDAEQWHLPYVEPEELLRLAEGPAVSGSLRAWELAVRVSTARCARVSYKTHDGELPTLEADLALYDRLVGAVPLHASPAEHQATPDVVTTWGWQNPQLHGNLLGWLQHRKMLANERALELNRYGHERRGNGP